MELTESQLEKINYSMKILILATTVFFILAFIVIFFGLFGISPQTSQQTLISLSPVILLLLVFSLVFNLTRYRCPNCRTFISRKKPCPVCAAIQKGKAASLELATREQPEIDSFLQEDIVEEKTSGGESIDIDPDEEL